MILAAEGSDPLLTGLGQLGVAGVILALLLTFGRDVIKRERERAEFNAAEVLRLNNSIQEKYIPSLLESQKALTDSNTTLAEVRALLAQLLVEKSTPKKRGG